MNISDFTIFKKSENIYRIAPDDLNVVNPFIDQTFESKKDAQGFLRNYFEEHVWDGDNYCFSPRRIRCEECGGEQEWCDCCHCYTRTCCVPYGTCLCS